MVARRRRALGAHGRTSVPSPGRHRAKRAPLRLARRERWSKLAAIAYRHGIERQDIEDVIQDALLDVLRSFPGPDHRDYVSAYAARCVERRALNRRRRIARARRRPSPRFPGRTPRRRRHEQRAELADPQAVDPADSSTSIARS